MSAAVIHIIITALDSTYLSLEIVEKIETYHVVDLTALEVRLPQVAEPRGQPGAARLLHP